MRETIEAPDALFGDIARRAENGVSSGACQRRASDAVTELKNLEISDPYGGRGWD